MATRKVGPQWRKPKDETLQHKCIGSGTGEQLSSRSEAHGLQAVDFEAPRETTKGEHIFRLVLRRLAICYTELISRSNLRR